MGRYRSISIYILLMLSVLTFAAISPTSTKLELQIDPEEFVSDMEAPEGGPLLVAIDGLLSSTGVHPSMLVTVNVSASDSLSIITNFSLPQCRSSIIPWNEKVLLLFCKQTTDSPYFIASVLYAFDYNLNQLWVYNFTQVLDLVTTDDGANRLILTDDTRQTLFAFNPDEQSFKTLQENLVTGSKRIVPWAAAYAPDDTYMVVCTAETVDFETAYRLESFDAFTWKPLNGTPLTYSSTLFPLDINVLDPGVGLVVTESESHHKENIYLVSYNYSNFESIHNLTVHNQSYSFSPIGALVWTTAFFTDSNYIFLAALDSSAPQNVIRVSQFDISDYTHPTGPVSSVVSSTPTPLAANSHYVFLAEAGVLNRYSYD